MDKVVLFFRFLVFLGKEGEVGGNGGMCAVLESE